ncbi:hypothetical protein CHLRE_11g482276v5 [Chlamydomonas reinhardtii]|uniref:Uncharacterized protein n=1 Tax=Chlamydomonas reinhardtii TaxID=3055 RepID=A0A2K3D8U9_CHLRE|nr:uncharacterized protein CHLRE_11g482276v5 [Chlamydomonas reinhardtii]PNW76946.1 hypothetical protein CHLRE_11g482276v5 [Chlamydomonas reinhardtii]
MSGSSSVPPGPTQYPQDSAGSHGFGESRNVQEEQTLALEVLAQAPATGQVDAHQDQ